jgi:hypothetical protein
VSGRAIRWGLAAAGALTLFYVSVLAGSGGWAHLADQARTDGWLLAPIIIASAAQVALSVELRRRRRAHRLAATTGAGFLGFPPDVNASPLQAFWP